MNEQQGTPTARVRERFLVTRGDGTNLETSSRHDAIGAARLTGGKWERIAPGPETALVANVLFDGPNEKLQDEMREALAAGWARSDSGTVWFDREGYLALHDEDDPDDGELYVMYAAADAEGATVYAPDADFHELERRINRSLAESFTIDDHGPTHESVEEAQRRADRLRENVSDSLPEIANGDDARLAVSVLRSHADELEKLIPQLPEEHPADDERSFLVHLNFTIPKDAPTDHDELQGQMLHEVKGALEVAGSDEDTTPLLARCTLALVDGEEVW